MSILLSLFVVIHKSRCYTISKYTTSGIIVYIFVFLEVDTHPPGRLTARDRAPTPPWARQTCTIHSSVCVHNTAASIVRSALSGMSEKWSRTTRHAGGDNEGGPAGSESMVDSPPPPATRAQRNRTTASGRLKQMSNKH